MEKTGPEVEETFIVAIKGFTAVSFKIIAYTSNIDDR